MASHTQSGWRKYPCAVAAAGRKPMVASGKNAGTTACPVRRARRSRLPPLTVFPHPFRPVRTGYRPTLDSGILRKHSVADPRRTDATGRANLLPRTATGTWCPTQSTDLRLNRADDYSAANRSYPVVLAGTGDARTSLASARFFRIARGDQGIYPDAGRSDRSGTDRLGTSGQPAVRHRTFVFAAAFDGRRATSRMARPHRPALSADLSLQPERLAGSFRKRRHAAPVAAPDPHDRRDAAPRPARTLPAPGRDRDRGHVQFARSGTHRAAMPGQRAVSRAKREPAGRGIER